jgi:hypothetical protein
MKVRSAFPRRPRLEELENRLVPSALATTSTNWSGYAVTAGRGAVTAVSGSWVVPTVSGSGTSYSSDWVGIDGFSSPTVEQIGTDSDLSGGAPQYYAWYEMYPSGSVEIPLAIHAGDTITASVAYGASGFTLSISDATTGKSFTTTKTASGAQRSSAEWVVEAPSSFSGILPLADFGKVTFTGAQATINGSTGAIDSFTASGEQVYSINMESRSGATEDTTSALTDSGSPTASSFAVTDTAATTSTPTPTPPSRPSWWSWWRSVDQVVSAQAASFADVAAALASVEGRSNAAPVAAGQPAAGAAPPVGAAAGTASIGPATLAGARLTGDVGTATGGQAVQPGAPEVLPAPDDAGQRGTPPARPTDPGATPAPSLAPPVAPGSDSAPAGGSGATAPEQTQKPVILPAGETAVEREAEAGVVLALAAVGLWGAPSAEKRRQSSRRRKFLHLWIF